MAGDPAAYRVYVRGEDYQRVCEISNDYTRFDFEPAFNDVGTWVVEASAESETARRITKTGGIIVTRELEGVETTIFSGPVATEYAFTATTFRAAGYCDNYWLLDPVRPSFLQAAPPFPDAEYVRTGQASFVMRALVSDQIGPTAPPARRFAPTLVFPADPLLGTTITARGNLQPILTLLAELAITPYAGGLGFYLRQSDTTLGALEFVVYAPADKSADAKFSVDLGTAQDYEDIRAAPASNRVLVMGGDGFGANRSIVEEVDAASVAEWGPQPGVVVDMRGTTDPSELNIRAAEEIAKVSTLTSTAITPFDVPSLQPGADYDLGTLVTIVTQAGEVVDLIRKIKYSLDPERGPTITPIVGQGDGDDDERTATITRTIQGRLSNIERNWNVPPESIDATMLQAGSVGPSELQSNSVIEPALDALDTPANDEILTYDSPTGRLEWQGINVLAANLSITSLTASGTVQASRLISTIATGTAPLSVSSTTKVTNFNADLLDGLTSSDFALASALAGYLLLTGGTVSGSLTVQGALQVDGNVTLGNAATDTVTIAGVASIGAGVTVLGTGGSNDQAVFIKHNSGAGRISLGGTNSASPDFIIKNNAGTQTARVTDAGVLIVGSTTAAIGTAGAGDVLCNDVWLFASGSNYRRLQAAGTSFQISGNTDSGTDMTIDSGIVTIKALHVDTNDVILGVNRISINGTGIGLFGASPIGRPTVTGTRTGTLAQLQSVVASLLSALDGSHLGAITDLTS